MLKLLILAIGWILTLSSYGSDYYDDLYQECDETNRDFTDQVIQTARSYCTPDGYGWPQCIDPEQKESLAQCDVQNLKTPNVIDFFKQHKWYHNGQLSEYNIPPICFLASTALGRHSWNNSPSPSRPYKANNKTYRYYHCNNSNEPKEHQVLYECTRSIQGHCFKEPYISKGQPPCSSKPYIQKAAKAFNEVTNCFDLKTKKEKTMAFGLLHHESRFETNKAEESGKTHRCFGQIDNRFIATLNQYIYFGDRKFDGTDKPHASKFFEYGDIYKKALGKCPFLKRSLTPHPSQLEGKTMHKELANGKKINPFEDAHLKNQQNFNSIICKTSQDIYSCLFYTIYNIPVTMKILEHYLKSHSEVNTIKTGEKEYKIFNEEDFYFKWAFVIWSHNAGTDIIKKDFEKFTAYLKTKIMNSNKSCQSLCPENSQNQECIDCKNYRKYRFNIFNQKPLNGEILIKEFQKYAETNNVSNQDQVKNIIDDIQKDLKAFTGTSLESAMKNLPRKPKAKQSQDEFRRADLSELLMNVARQCPTELPNYEERAR